MSTQVTPIDRNLPGEPIPREELVRQYEEMKWRNRGPVESFLFEVHIPKPEDTYQWRIELECGCIRDTVTREDTVEALMARSSGNYHFSMQKPSQREIDEQRDREVEEDARAKFKGEDPPVRPSWPSVHGKERLPAGQWLCEFCPNRPRSNGPVREIVEWFRRRDDLKIMEAFEHDGETVIPVGTYALWDVVLSCGHFTQELTDPKWKLDAGYSPERPPKGGFRGLKDVLRVVCGDADDEAYWRRVHAEKHPKPVPFTQCRTCANIRTVVAYERLGWVAPKPKPPKQSPKPKPPSRRSLQSKLGKLEAEAARIRKQLEELKED